MKLIKVSSNSAAEQAGPQVANVIRSTNDYLTTESGDVEPIIANAAS
jgi:hypothetical protein